MSCPCKEFDINKFLETTTTECSECGTTVVPVIEIDSCFNNKCDNSKLDLSYFFTKSEIDELLSHFGTSEELALAINNILFNELDPELGTNLIGAINKLKEILDTKLDKNATNEYISSLDKQTVQDMTALIHILR